MSARDRLYRAGLPAVAGLLLLSGCAGGASDADGRPSEAASSSAAASSGSTTGSTVGSGPLSVEQPWLKAADSGMTAAFGQLRNDGDSPVALTGASAEGIAGEVELHETVADPQTGATTMQALEEPIVIEPGEAVELEPGGDHIMLMDLQCAPMAGTQLSVELQFEDGSAQAVELPVRDYAGAQEEYAPGEESTAGESHAEEPAESAESMEGMDDMSGMDHGAMEEQGEALPMCEAGR